MQCDIKNAYNGKAVGIAFVKGAGGDYYSCVVDTDPDNDYVEIVDWRVIKEASYIQMKNQVEKAE